MILPTPLTTEAKPSPTAPPEDSLAPSTSFSQVAENASAETTPPTSDTNHADDAQNQNVDQTSDTLTSAATTIGEH